MTLRLPTVLAVAVVTAALPAPVRAFDQMVPGRILFLRNNLDPTKRTLKFVSKELSSSNSVLGNPMGEGASFEVVLQPELGTGSQQCFTLPALGWTQLYPVGFKYSDKQGTFGAVKLASIKRMTSGTFVIKVVAKGTIGPITVEPPTRTAGADVFFRIEDHPEDARYCAIFGGEFVANGVSAFKAKDAPTPSACAAVSLACSPSGAFLE